MITHSHGKEVMDMIISTGSYGDSSFIICEDREGTYSLFRYRGERTIETHGLEWTNAYTMAAEWASPY